jgi:putative exporter of polyketide antibiotics
MGLGAFAVPSVVCILGGSGPHMDWLLWLTPFGWAHLLRPCVSNVLLAVLLAAAIGAVGRP